MLILFYIYMYIINVKPMQFYSFIFNILKFDKFSFFCNKKKVLMRFLLDIIIIIVTLKVNFFFIYTSNFAKFTSLV